MDSPINTLVQQLIDQHDLPSGFAAQVEQWYVPLADTIARTYDASKPPMLVAIQGCQGSGKSTLAAFLQLLMQDKFQLSACVLSMDDVYHTLATREALAVEKHALFRTRGVPGTHDIALAMRTLNALRTAAENTITSLPGFNKAIDDRKPESVWKKVCGRPQLIILEGWCLAAGPMPEDDLAIPLNDLEAREDPNAIWRREINQRLAAEYQKLNALIDYLIVLSAPGFDCVLQWRSLQEQKLRKRLLAENDPAANSVQTTAQLQRFIQHFERLTRHCAATLPANADTHFQLNESQQIVSAQQA